MTQPTHSAQTSSVPRYMLPLLFSYFSSDVLAKTLIFFAKSHGERDASARNKRDETESARQQNATPTPPPNAADPERARTSPPCHPHSSLFRPSAQHLHNTPLSFQQHQFVNMPISLPGYNLGDEGKPDHFDSATTREQAAIEAASLTGGDAAFIKRSDLKWTYAVVSERVEEDGGIILRFDVDKDKNRKSFPQAQWGKYIRVIKVVSEDSADATPVAPPTAEEKTEQPVEVKKEEEKPVAEPEEVKKDATPDFPSSSVTPASEEVEAEATATSNASEGSAKSPKKSGWLGSLFASSKKEEEKTDEVAVAAPEAPKEEVPPTVDVAIAKSEEPSKAEESPAPLPPMDEKDEAKENSALTSPKAFLPSPKNHHVLQESSQSNNSMSSISLKKKNSFKNSLLSFGKIGKKNSPPKPEDKKVIVRSPPTSPTDISMSSPAGSDNKEWFDPNVFEVDYDKNPTDLFQALEARQFSYAEEMFKQTNKQFNKECKTWVVARAQKKSEKKQLRFRALPLHAALVFGAPDDLIKKILDAYPLATRGRDVKGRLPIHLAYEHESSDDVIQIVLEAFPRGFLAKDKKEMTPLEYIGGNSERAGLKKAIPLILSASAEAERAKMEEEKAKALSEQKQILHEDPEFMQHILTAITEDVETTYAGKMELVEKNYQKEIELLKKKHDSETQALLEGFEVKLNFERKLLKLKSAKA